MGGAAIKSAVRINQENVEQTIKNIFNCLLPMLKLDKKDVAILGSTGKKLPGGSSGDIDLAFDKNVFLEKFNISEKELFEQLIDFSKLAIWFAGCPCVEDIEYNYIKGLGLVSIGWPIANTDGKQTDQFVQLDLIPTDNLEMTKWGMFSPYEKDEPYKGAVRNELFYWIANEIDYNDVNSDGSVIERCIFEPMKGLVRLRQSRLGAKGQLLKTKKTEWRKVINDDPNEIVKLMFGEKYKPSDFMSTQGAWDAFMDEDFPYKEKREQILKRTIEGLEKKKVLIPNYFKL